VSGFEQLRAWARRAKRDLIALWLAARDPRVPWYAKAMATVVVAYAVSPIDLIPDFIPVLGYVDDLILLPLGIALAIHLIPQDVFDDLRRRAAREAPVLHRGLAPAVVIVLVWLLAAVIVLQWLVDTHAQAGENSRQGSMMGVAMPPSSVCGRSRGAGGA
jgi:uncharacterized membrane protein YkvA (DUF1232 family)